MTNIYFSFFTQNRTFLNVSFLITPHFPRSGSHFQSCRPRRGGAGGGLEKCAYQNFTPPGQLYIKVVLPWQLAITMFKMHPLPNPF